MKTVRISFILCAAIAAMADVYGSSLLAYLFGSIAAVIGICYILWGQEDEKLL